MERILERTLGLDMVERIQLSGFLSTLGGDYPTLVLLESTIDAVLGADEKKRLNIVQTGDSVTWDPDVPDQTITVKFGREVLRVITVALERLNEAEKLDFSTKRLYEIFVLEQPPAQ